METAFPQYQWEAFHPPQALWTETPMVDAHSQHWFDP